MFKRIVFLLLFCAGFTGMHHAQLCTPNPSYTVPGVYPDTVTNFANGCMGQFYLQDFTVVVPADTFVFGFNFTINYLRIDSIGGLPAGMIYSCNPPTCTFPGGTNGCAQFYGILPPVTATYSLTIYVTLQAYHPFFGIVNIVNYFTGYRLHVGAAPLLTTGQLSATCGGSNGMAWVNASGPVTYTSYTWNTAPVSFNDTIFNQSAGVYTVTVSDALGCSASSTVTIGNAGAPVIDSLLTSDVPCHGGNTGSAQVYTSGGAPGYTYAWSNSGTTAQVSGLSAGSYTVTITDQNNCQVSTVTTITEPSVLNAVATGNDVQCSGGSDGTALVTTSGGSAPYSYLWNTSATQPSLSGLIAGSYSVTVTDAQGCTTTSSVSLTEPSALVLSTGSINISCYGSNDGMAHVSASGGTPGYTYTWSNTGTNDTIQNLSAGSYTVIITDAHNCTQSATVTLTEPAALSLSLSGIDETLLGAADGGVNTSVSGGMAPYTFLWNNSATTQNLTNISGGTYILTVTDTNGCTATDSVTILTLSGAGLQEFPEHWTVFPNPAQDIISVHSGDYTGAYTLSLYSLSGNCLVQRNSPGGTSILSLHDISPGMYILVLRTEEALFRRSIIKQ